MALAPLAAACQSAPAHDAGPRRVEAFVGWVEKVHVESELSQHAVRDAIDGLGAVVAEDTTADPVLAFGEFVAAIERSEERCAALTVAVEEMQTTAEPLFSQWREDLDQFSSDRLRERSTERLEEKEQAFTDLRDGIAPTVERLQALNKSLRDLALFLSHDLNESAMEELSGDLLGMQDEAAGLDGALRESCDMALEYLASSALPKASEVSPVGGALAAPPGGAVDESDSESEPR